MIPTYVIKDWDIHFETNESRKVRNARWVPVPNKHDGKGFRRIAQDKNGVSIFCGWNLILQVASKTPKRGVLADHDGPLTAEDLSAKTGFPVKVFEQALSFLSDRRIGWIAVEKADAGDPGERADTPAEDAGIPATPRAEGKGIEGNGTEGKLTAQARQVFDAWKETLNHPKSVLDAKRERFITARIKDGYSVEQLQDAARGCKSSAYHQGQNESKTVYDRIDLIYRDAEHVDQFLSFLSSTNGKAVVKVVESAEAKAVRESCTRCFGTGTEQVQGKGARACKHEGAEHATGIIHSCSESVKGASENRTESIS